MSWVRLIASAILQIVFGSFASGGLMGLIAIWEHWGESQEDERGVLWVMVLLCASAVFVGIKGIFVTKKRARNEEIVTQSWNDSSRRSALGNVIAGALLLTIGVVWFVIASRAAREVSGGVPIWTGPIGVGLSQFVQGIIQTVKKRKLQSANTLPWHQP